MKMEYQKITNLLGTKPDEVPRFHTKKQKEVHDKPGNAEGRYKPSKQIRLKTSMLRSDLCDFSDAYTVLTSIGTKDANREFLGSETGLQHLKTMHHLLIVSQRSILY